MAAQAKQTHKHQGTTLFVCATHTHTKLAGCQKECERLCPSQASKELEKKKQQLRLRTSSKAVPQLTHTCKNYSWKDNDDEKNKTVCVSVIFFYVSIVHAQKEKVVSTAAFKVNVFKKTHFAL